MTMVSGRAAGVVMALLVVGCGGASSLPIEGSSGSGVAGAGGGGPGGNPLVGTWETSIEAQGTVADESITFQSDGTAIETATLVSVGSASCTGSLQFSGVAWTATTTTITLSGDGAPCTGSYSCSDGITGTCTSSPLVTMTCDYTLSDGDDTLVLDCPGSSSVTFTRQG